MTLKVFNVGDVLAAADVNEYLVNNRFAVKAADTSRTSNATLSNDPDLSVTADANKYYDMYLNFSYISPTAAGLSYAVTVPSGTVFTGSSWVVNTGTGAIGQAVAYSSAAGQLSVTQNLTSTTSTIYNVTLIGTLDTAGTGGAVTLQWAQTISTASATLVKQGSSLRLRRVA